MRAFVSVSHAPKSGSEEAEYEDASAVHPVVDTDELVEIGPIHLAVADGASESLLSKNWAQVLTSEILRTTQRLPGVCESATDFSAGIQSAVEAWDIWLNGYLSDREEMNRPVKWYEKPGLDRGAHSTILVAHLHDSDDKESGYWHASAIGDTCIFQVRDELLIDSFPASASSDFDSSPPLVNSKNKDLTVWERNVMFSSGSYQSGDQFFAGTDALAAWFLSTYEQGGHPWEQLRDLSCRGDHDEFRAWVNHERNAARMRNDDVTLVHVDLG